MSPKKIINVNKHMKTYHGKHMKKLEEYKLKSEKASLYLKKAIIKMTNYTKHGQQWAECKPHTLVVGM